jgi:hypothetical protein
MGGDMTGKSPTGEDYENLGRKQERTVFPGCWIFSGFEEFGFGVLVNHCRGHQVAGGFGLGGQDSLRYPGAREPDRLLLAGWVVSRFWAGFGQISRLDKATGRTTR